MFDIADRTPLDRFHKVMFFIIDSPQSTQFKKHNDQSKDTYFYWPLFQPSP